MVRKASRWLEKWRLYVDRKGSCCVHPEHILGTYLTMTSTIGVVSNTARVVFLAGRSFGRATIKDDGRETSDD